jgi:hypothetical protein
LALCLVKTVFFPLVGLLGLAVVLMSWDGRSSPLALAISNLKKNAWSYLKQGVVPILIVCAILLWVNQTKFGSPFNLGYERETNLFGGRLAESIPAYLFAARFSIFVHFPLLAIGLLGIPRFWKQHRYELVVVWTFFATMFFIYGSYTYWTAEASYGPRYLLFALPVLSLPTVAVVDRLRGAKGVLRRGLPTIALAALVLGGVVAQTYVNRLEFHTFFRLRQQFQSMERRDVELWNYLRDTNTVIFNRDFIRYRDENVLPVPMQRLEEILEPERFEKLEASVRAHLASNHYFF